MWYIRTRTAEGDEIRFPLDEKVTILHEGIEYEAVGMIIDVYDSTWHVATAGTMGAGDSEEPCMGLVLRDPFTFSQIEVPLVEEPSRALAAAILKGWDEAGGAKDQPEPERPWWKRPLRRG